VKAGGRSENMERLEDEEGGMEPKSNAPSYDVCQCSKSGHLWPDMMCKHSLCSILLAVLKFLQPLGTRYSSASKTQSNSSLAARQCTESV